MWKAKQLVEQPEESTFFQSVKFNAHLKIGSWAYIFYRFRRPVKRLYLEVDQIGHFPSFHPKDLLINPQLEFAPGCI